MCGVNCDAHPEFLPNLGTNLQVLVNKNTLIFGGKIYYEGQTTSGRGRKMRDAALLCGSQPLMKAKRYQCNGYYNYSWYLGLTHRLLILLFIIQWSLSMQTVRGGEWIQRGVDINGEAADDESGYSTALSSNGSILAVGAYANDGGGSGSGHVRVYRWSGSIWNQMGADIDGPSSGSGLGVSVDLSSDGTWLAAGVYGYNAAQGLARVYVWSGSAWIQRGSDITGEAVDDHFGFSVSLSREGTLLAVSAFLNDGSAGSNSGHVRVFAWSGTSWSQRGSDIDGEAADDQSGYSMSLSASGSVLAVGAIYNDGAGVDSGHVRVFEWSGSSWSQRGSDIDGEAEGDRMGIAVSLSSLGTILAAGAYLNNDGGSGSGHVRVFEWSGSSWVQRGSAIAGIAASSWFGYSVELNSDGDMLVAGGFFYNSNSGYAQVYMWTGSTWSQEGNTLYAEASGDQFGYLSSISGDGSTLAVGARYNDGGGSNSGHTRVFTFVDSPTSQPSSQPSNQPSDQPSIQPSPQPTGQPASEPSPQPSARPSNQPSDQPSIQPSPQPTGQPSSEPSPQPSARPSNPPSSQPSCQPSVQPTCQPSSMPTTQPSSHPTAQPTTQPSSQPTAQPTFQPSFQPTAPPSSPPTTQPTSQPSSQPTSQPQIAPSSHPTAQPSGQPTVQPSIQPSYQTSVQPTALPSCQPSSQPSSHPTIQPSSQPTGEPTMQPSEQPSSQPSARPSSRPSTQPSRQPTKQPSSRPSAQPVTHPSTHPSSEPSAQPTIRPSVHPSSLPSGQPTQTPSSQPSGHPSAQPSKQPVPFPTSHPTNLPSARPVSLPTAQPSCTPSAQPTSQPSHRPSSRPRAEPSSHPSSQPSCQPSSRPSGQPTSYPSRQPSCQPLSRPTGRPTHLPSSNPSSQPTESPFSMPSSQPSPAPTSIPSMRPSGQPTRNPSGSLSSQPTNCPSAHPSRQPTLRPTVTPSSQPTTVPTNQPGTNPTAMPTLQPSSEPSSRPTISTPLPTHIPTPMPTRRPSRRPSVSPSQLPSVAPSFVPSVSLTPTLESVLRSPTRTPSRHPTVSPTLEPSAMPTVDLLLLSEIVAVFDLPVGVSDSSVSLPTIDLAAVDNSQGETSVDLSVPVGEGAVSLKVTAEIVQYDALPWNQNETEATVRVPVLESNVLSIAVEIGGANISSFRPSFVANMSHLVGVSRSSDDYYDEAVFFRHNCSQGSWEQVLFSCPGNTSQFNMTCYGTAGVSVVRVCPVLRRGCNVLSLETFAVTDSSYCEVTFTTRMYTICTCGDSERRRLQHSSLSADDESDDTDSNDDSSDVASSAVSVAVMSEYVASDFSSTLVSSSTSLSGNHVVADSAVILYAIGVMWCAGLLLGVTGAVWTSVRYRRRQVLLDKSHFFDTVRPIGVGHEHLVHMEVSNGLVTQSSIESLVTCFINEVLPVVFENRDGGSLLFRIWREIYNRHPYCRALRVLSGDMQVVVYPFLKSPNVRLAMVLGEIFTTITLSWFVLAMLFDLQFPSDDGTCGLWTSSDTCSSRTSFLDSSQTYCTWTRYRGRRSSLVVGRMIERDVVNAVSRIISSDDIVLPPESDRHLCQYNDFSPSFVSTVIVAMVTSVIAGLFMSPIHILFEAAASTSIVLTEQNKPSRWKLPMPISALVPSCKVIKLHNVLQGNARAVDSGPNDPDDDGNSMSQFFRTKAIEQHRLEQQAHRSLVEFSNIWDQALSKTALNDFTRLCCRPSRSNGVFSDPPLEVVQHFEAVVKGMVVRSETFQLHTSAINKCDIEVRQGILVFQQFISDLLGSTSRSAESRLFEHTLESDPSRQVLWMLPVWVRMLAVAVLVLMNVFAVYYTLLRGLQQGAAWQVTFVLACVAQTLSDVLFFQVVDVILLYVVIPSLIYEDVRMAVYVVNQLVMAMRANLLDRYWKFKKVGNVETGELIDNIRCDKQEDLKVVASSVETSNEQALDVTRYFFASSRLAREKWPCLWESAVVASYHSIWPVGLVRGALQLDRRWSEVGDRVRGEDAQGEAVRGWRRVVLGVVMSMPMWVLHMVVRSLEPFLLTAILLLWLFVQSMGGVAIAVFVVIICLCMGGIILRSHSIHRGENKGIIAPNSSADDAICECDNEKINSENTGDRNLGDDAGLDGDINVAESDCGHDGLSFGEWSLSPGTSLAADSSIEEASSTDTDAS